MKINLVIYLLIFYILNKLERGHIGTGRVNRSKPNLGCPNNKGEIING